MASGASTDVGNSLLAMFAIDLRLVVFMAVVTGIAAECVGMAGAAA
jgi:hypothetical protein